MLTTIIDNTKFESGNQLPIFVNSLTGSLVIHTADNYSGVRKWYFFHDSGYVLFLRLINLTNLNPYVYTFNIYKGNTINDELVYSSLLKSTNYLELNVKSSNALAELITAENSTQNVSFTIEYLFQKLNSRSGVTNSFSKQMKAVGNESTTTTSFYQQPSFIALIKSMQKKAKHSLKTTHPRHPYSLKERVRHFIQGKPSKQTDQSHLTSLTSSFSSYSVDQKRNHIQPTTIPIQNNNKTLLDQSPTSSNMINNAILPSQRYQQSIMNAYLTDLQSFHPNINPREMNNYLFVDLHSTSSETFPDGSADYEASTTTNIDDAIETVAHINNQNPKYSRRNIWGKNDRKQRHLNAVDQPRFLMRERQLPVNMLSLPQLRSLNIFQNDNTTTSINTLNQNSSSTSTEFSVTDDDFDNSHFYHVNQNPMKIIKEEVEVEDDEEEEEDDIPQHHSTFRSLEYQLTSPTMQSISTNQRQNRIKHFNKRSSIPVQTGPSMILNANHLLDRSTSTRKYNDQQNIFMQNNNSFEQQQYFEKVSTNHGDDSSDTSLMNNESKVNQIGDGIAYINDSILV
ncbi:unnamed protein product [Didymodactylos carnosus]|uniref:Uncharacterized protein n=1 Tax=Didymodactylos carnosus TaxID=1234261 RepID=A0A814TYW8_9BILA|nr:unnamed protein product [Didymodactylos carnosus]CAF1167659.1 unnamed protein product [Didymodactylos carnosus]CAF3554867.1 unnamed protein product [Didymodactylos carnosus]CAF3931270.1 unnamed protein product [Didymodactylos carnosus]